MICYGVLITLSYNYECFVLRITDTTKMYHSQKSARQSMFDCGRAHTRTHHDGIMDLGDRKELSPYANLTNIAPWSMESLLFPGVWQAYPASLKLACDFEVASTNRKEGPIL